MLADRMGTLEALARKELAAEPFTDEETAFLKKIIDQDPFRGSGGPPRYDGWYPQLCYRGGGAAWDPVVADVHTDPASGSVLEVGVGDVNFLVIAIDSEDDRTAFVGPVYSYYEFRHPLRDRLTDQQWHKMIAGGELPARPAWTDVFQAPGVQRKLDQPPLEQVLEIRRRVRGEKHLFTVNLKNSLALRYQEKGRYEEAGALLLEIYEVIKDAPQDRAGIRAKREALGRLVKLYDAWGKPETAAQYRALLREAEGAGASD